MPVLVTGAESSLGRVTVQRLLRGGGEVRAFLDAEVSGDGDAARVRARGIKTALGTLDDEGHLESALEQVHTVVHLWGGPLVEPAAALDALATVAAAALGARCRRLVWVSEVALSSSGAGANPYLDAVAQGEALLAGLPLETVVLRCGLRYGAGDALTQALAAGALSGSEAIPHARHAPVLVDDVAGAVAVADRQRGSGRDLHVQVELVGPTEVTLGEFVGLLGGPPIHDARPALALPGWVPDWLSRDALGGPNALGRQGTTLTQGLRVLRGSGPPG